jgi:hypothetical protein
MRGIGESATDAATPGTGARVGPAPPGFARPPPLGLEPAPAAVGVWSAQADAMREPHTGPRRSLVHTRVAAVCERDERCTALADLVGGGLATALLARQGSGRAAAQVASTPTMSPAIHAPNTFVLEGPGTRIGERAAAAMAEPTLTYRGPLAERDSAGTRTASTSTGRSAVWSAWSWRRWPTTGRCG